MMGREGNLPALFLCMGKSSAHAAPSMDDDYRAESDHQTLCRAADVRMDKKRMAGVKRHHAKTKASLGRVGRSLGGRR